MRSLILLAIPASLAVGPFAQAATCYRFTTFDSPENLPLATARDADDASQPHVWCYESVKLDGQPLVYAYSAIDGETDPALSALTSFSKSGEILAVAHGSQLRGEMNFTTSELRGFNPLSRPLDPVNAALIGEPVVVTLDSEQERNAEVTLSSLKREISRPHAQAKIQVGTTEKYLDAAKYPYKAYWWPHSGLPLLGPLGKYDAIVASMTGTDPRSREWESATHSLQHVSWGGHCNGWAASSVLYPEYAEPRHHAATNTTLTTSDFNGMLAEASFCVDWAFFGKRNNGLAGDDPRDIAPHRFHEVFLHYIGKLGKPIAMDYVTGASVDNHVSTGYKFVVTPVTGAANTYDVQATIQMHGYDRSLNNNIGPADIYTSRYHYTLTTDAAGNITGGTWAADSGNPDFLWVPLAQKNCGRENPRIDPRKIAQMIALPLAPVPSPSPRP